jgi:hypothetical protein
MLLTITNNYFNNYVVYNSPSISKTSKLVIKLKGSDYQVFERVGKYAKVFLDIEKIDNPNNLPPSSFDEMIVELSLSFNKFIREYLKINVKDEFIITRRKNGLSYHVIYNYAMNVRLIKHVVVLFKSLYKTPNIIDDCVYSVGRLFKCPCSIKPSRANYSSDVIESDSEHIFVYSTIPGAMDITKIDEEQNCLETFVKHSLITHVDDVDIYDIPNKDQYTNVLTKYDYNIDSILEDDDMSDSKLINTTYSKQDTEFKIVAVKDKKYVLEANDFAHQTMSTQNMIKQAVSYKKKGKYELYVDLLSILKNATNVEKQTLYKAKNLDIHNLYKKVDSLKDDNDDDNFTMLDDTELYLSEFVNSNSPIYVNSEEFLTSLGLQYFNEDEMKSLYFNLKRFHKYDDDEYYDEFMSKYYIDVLNSCGVPTLMTNAVFVSKTNFIITKYVTDKNPCLVSSSVTTHDNDVTIESYNKLLNEFIEKCDTVCNKRIMLAKNINVNPNIEHNVQLFREALLIFCIKTRCKYFSYEMAVAHCDKLIYKVAKGLPVVSISKYDESTKTDIYQRFRSIISCYINKDNSDEITKSELTCEIMKNILEYFIVYNDKLTQDSFGKTIMSHISRNNYDKHSYFTDDIVNLEQDSRKLEYMFRNIEIDNASTLVYYDKGLLRLLKLIKCIECFYNSKFPILKDIFNSLFITNKDVELLLKYTENKEQYFMLSKNLSNSCVTTINALVYRGNNYNYYVIKGSDNTTQTNTTQAVQPTAVVNNGAPLVLPQLVRNAAITSTTNGVTNPYNKVKQTVPVVNNVTNPYNKVKQMTTIKTVPVVNNVTNPYNEIKQMTTIKTVPVVNNVTNPYNKVKQMTTIKTVPVVNGVNNPYIKNQRIAPIKASSIRKNPIELDNSDEDSDDDIVPCINGNSDDDLDIVEDSDF